MEKEKKGISLINQIMIGVVLGVISGVLFPQISQQISIIGDIFLRLMQMAIPLLVLGQIVQALGGIDRKELSTIGIRTILIFAISSILASYWGILAGLIFKPGSGIDMSLVSEEAVQAQELSIAETLVAFFPSNIMQSLSQGTIIQIIIFALFFGLALNKFMASKPDSKLTQLIEDFNDVITNVIRLVMNFAPIGIFSLMASTIGETGLGVIMPLLSYLLIFAAAMLVFMGLWIMVVSLYCRISPMDIIRGIKNMSIVAVSTVSSAITLPVAMEDTKGKLGVSNRIADLVLPLGVSLNSNGAAMHMAITVITVAQMYGIEMTLQTIIYLGVLATFVSLANAVVPGASLVSLAIIFPQVGLPLESIALFAGLDYFVGMIRTILNVDSDVFTAMLVAKSVGEFNFDKNQVSE